MPSELPALKWLGIAVTVIAAFGLAFGVVSYFEQAQTERDIIADRLTALETILEGEHEETHGLVSEALKELNYINGWLNGTGNTVSPRGPRP